ncbi:MAG: crotonase/enoyl-CoA hydratase family protein [Ilumatobacteraceae bacterium]
MSSNTERVTISVVDRIADVRMVRADKRNALDNDMFNALASVGEQLKTMNDVRAIVLSGEGASFCAGLDFGSFQVMASSKATPETTATINTSPRLNAGDITDGRITHMAQQVCWVWQEIPVPVIAAIHGHALGGGLQIALGTDIRIVHPDTQLSIREVHWGLIPDMTGTLMLSRLVRPDIAKDLVFSARIFSGTEAFEIGVATRLSNDPLRDSFALAAEIAQRSPEAIREAKQLLNRLANAGAAEQFAAERQAIGKLIGSPNQIEAVMAHFEKRPASFNPVT